MILKTYRQQRPSRLRHLPSSINKPASSNCVIPASITRKQDAYQMNESLLEHRRESRLNSLFNVRRNKLKCITEENKLIYGRISSQKSLYAQDAQRKSYEKLKSISSSRSRSRSRSRDPSSGRKRQDKKCTRKNFVMRQKTQHSAKQTFMTIQYHHIQKIKEANIKDFQNLFNKSKQKNNFISKKVVKKHHTSLSLHPCHLKPKEKKQNNLTGNLLHSIQEELYKQKKQR